jgi:hypothetical protein
LSAFFHNGTRYLEKKIEYGYAIDIDVVTLWKRYNLRSAVAIGRNHVEIEKLLSSKIYPRKIHFIFSKSLACVMGLTERVLKI